MSFHDRARNPSDSLRMFKVITAGDGGVGKTTLLHRYVEGKFLSDTIMTIGVGFYSKKVTLDNGDTYSLQFWDFGGEEHFRPFLDSYATGASGAILMFDLTRPATLKAIDKWVSIIRKEDPNRPIIFVGSKWDLKEKITVSDKYAMEYKEEYDFFDYIKTSSKTGQNVEEIFKRLTEQIIKTTDAL